MTTGNKIITISFEDYLSDGILKEKNFRTKIDRVNWEKYSNKNILIKGCASSPIPTWAYMILVAKLVPYANKILFGELCSAYEIYKK